MDSKKAKGGTVRILYEKGKGGAIAFPINELKVFLSLLKGLYKAMPLDFIKEAIQDVENDMRPQQLPFINYWRICELCLCEFDERTGSGFLNNQNGKSQWKHYRCPELKPNRPV